MLLHEKQTKPHTKVTRFHRKMLFGQMLSLEIFLIHVSLCLKQLKEGILHSKT